MGVFVKVADLGSFAAAADALQMSPQMVAKHIVFLEDRLGAALIRRTTRRQSLTDIGRAYYERCKSILFEAEAAESLAHDMQSRPRGALRINAAVTFGAFSLAPFITRYLERYPETEIELTLNDRFVDPLEDGFEVMVRIGEVDETSLIARALAPYGLIACASPAYLAARGAPCAPADLERHDCLIYSYGSMAPPCPWRFTRDGAAFDPRVNGRFRSNDWKALLHAAQAGFGVIVGPESVLAAEVAARRLVRVLPDYLLPSRPMHVLTPAGRRPSAKVRTFVEALIAEFGVERAVATVDGAPAG